MSIVTDFKSINKILDRKEPGTEHDATAPFQGVTTGGSSVQTSGVSEHLPPYTPQPSSHTPPFWSVPLDEALREWRNGRRD